MPKILDTQWNIFNDNQVSNADDVSENIYFPGASRGSLETMNGHLDGQNLPAFATTDYWEVPSELVQDNTFTGGSMVGATGNMDFFRNPLFSDAMRNEVFGPDELGGTGSSGEQNADDEDFTSIPGASMEFYLPYDCSLVLITWNIQFEDDAYPASTLAGIDGDYDRPSDAANTTTLGRTWLRLYVDNSWVQGQERITHPYKYHAIEAGTILKLRYPPSGDVHAARYWNGHHAAATSNGTGLSKGWHSASIRLFSNSSQARVRVRGIRHVYFR
tara:strand:+ start:858 stop:1676 length:819 start_codon:yes stop_codon:yes gene_type:complete